MPGGQRSDDNPARDAKGSSAGATPAAFAGAGFQFAASILAFLFLGRWLDGKLGTAPWLLILGVFVGAGAGFYSMYRRLMASEGKGDGQR